MQKKVLVGKREVKFPVRTGMPEGGGELLMLLDMVYRLSSQLEMDPKVYRIQEECSLWLYYEYSGYECEAFLEEFGAYMALISEKFLVTVYGTAGEKESVEMEAKKSPDGRSFDWIRKNISGKEFDQIGDICVRIGVDCAQSLTNLRELFENMSFRRGCAAVRRSPFIREQFRELAEADSDTYYCYLNFDEEPEEGVSLLLESLSVEQKTGLWELFLQDGVSPLEFEMMMEEIGEGAAGPLFSWELSLRIALSESKTTVSYEDGDFKVTDRSGRRFKFDYLHGTAAERLFLKILFPVKAGEHGNLQD